MMLVYTVYCLAICLILPEYFWVVLKSVKVGWIGGRGAVW